MHRVRGVDIAALDSGVGTPFFWGHGFTGSASDESNNLLDWKRLAARFRVVRWDARGHGGSGGADDPDEYRWDNLGRDLLALADSLGVDRFSAGGVSMGTATALHAATLAPERFIGLVLTLPPSAYETRPAQAAEYRLGADLVEREGIDAYIARVNAQPVPEILSRFSNRPAFAPSVREERFPAVLRGAAASDLPPAETVRAITAPALILAWDTDSGHPLSTAEALAGLLPNAVLEVATSLRDVVTWTARVEAFLDQVAAGRSHPAASRKSD